MDLVKSRISIFWVVLLLGIGIVLLGGCARVEVTLTPTLTQVPEIINTPTDEIPTIIPEPLAAKVNGVGIPLTLFKAELLQYKNIAIESGSNTDPKEETKIVLDKLVDDYILAKAAEEAGYLIDDNTLNAKSDALKGAIKDGGTLKDWQERNGYTEDAFKVALRISMMATWQRDQIISSVADTTEQVNARQILVLDAALAEKIYSQLKSGEDFTVLARQYDPQLGGTLGWFPRGYLTLPELEDAAFILQPGQYSPVVKTAFGYQIIQVVERQAQRKLTPDALKALQKKAIEKWLIDKRGQSKIEILSLGG